jgi:ectoine hydroxylase-related dioxygenase (phytanoyl-CoA dioxygenase family)
MPLSQTGHSVIETFKRDGFARLSKLVPGTIIARAHAAVPDVIASAERIFGRCQDCGGVHYDFAERDCGNLTRPFVQLFNAWALHPAFRDLVFHPSISQAARALLECQEVRLIHDQLLIKRPGDVPTSAHIDGNYWPFDGSAFTFWVPLVDVSIAMGTVQFYRGTHLRDIARARSQAADEETASRVIADWIAEQQLEPEGFELRQGDVTIHDKWTIHCTQANASSITRVVLAIHVMDARSKRFEALGPMQRGHVDLFHWQGIPSAAELYGAICPVM